jgi:hypothetical protein
MEKEETEVIRTDDVKVSEEYQFNKFNLSDKLQKSLAAMKFFKVSFKFNLQHKYGMTLYYILVNHFSNLKLKS